MSDVRPLPLWPHDLNAHRPVGDTSDWNHWRAYLLRQAKAEISTPFQVRTEGAVPGGPVRVLAFGLLPPFACESVLISPENVFKPESVRKALEVYFTADEDHPNVISHARWLSIQMGVQVEYLWDEPFIPRKPGEPVIKGPNFSPRFR